MDWIQYLLMYMDSPWNAFSSRCKRFFFKKSVITTGVDIVLEFLIEFLDIKWKRIRLCYFSA